LPQNISIVLEECHCSGTWRYRYTINARSSRPLYMQLAVWWAQRSVSEEPCCTGPQRSMSASDITTLQTHTLELHCSGRKHENIQ